MLIRVATCVPVLLSGGSVQAQSSAFGAEVMVRHEDWNWFGEAGDTYQLQFVRARIDISPRWERLDSADGVKINALKNMRLGDRLLSSFEWSAFARAFDGVQLDGRLGEGLPLTVSWLYPTQGGWEQDFNETMDDVRVATVAITAAKDRYIPGGELGLFFHAYNDTRPCNQRGDNSGTTLATEADIDVYVTGAHLLGVAPLAGGQWDYLLWGTVPWGDSYELDHSAYAMSHPNHHL